MSRSSLFSFTVFVLLVISMQSLPAGDWTQFRGPGGAGISDEENLPTQWSEQKNLKWKVTLPGPGSSSPIVFGDRLFVTCYSGYGVEGSTGDVDDLKRHLLCLRADDGSVLWSKTVESTAAEDPWRGYIREHGYASSTPACDGEYVYVFFGKTGALAFDLEGKEIWRRNLETESANRRWGSAASPILSGDLLIVNASEESRSLYALDKRTGRDKWKVETDKTDELLAHNVFESDQSDFNGSPAVSGGRLFLRSNKSLYCIEAN